MNPPAQTAGGVAARRTPLPLPRKCPRRIAVVLARHAATQGRDSPFQRTGATKIPTNPTGRKGTKNLQPTPRKRAGGLKTAPPPHTRQRGNTRTPARTHTPLCRPGRISHREQPLSGCLSGNNLTQPREIKTTKPRPHITRRSHNRHRTKPILDQHVTSLRINTHVNRLIRDTRLIQRPLSRNTSTTTRLRINNNHNNPTNQLHRPQTLTVTINHTHRRRNHIRLIRPQLNTSPTTLRLRHPQLPQLHVNRRQTLRRRIT